MVKNKPPRRREESITPHISTLNQAITTNGLAEK